MAKRSAQHQPARDDDSVALGLAALGGVVGTIWQTIRHGDLAQQHQQLQGFAAELHQRYQEVVARHNFIAEQYALLRASTDQLRGEVAQLRALLDRGNRETARLLGERATLEARVRELEAHQPRATDRGASNDPT